MATHDKIAYCYDGPTLGANGSGRYALPVSAVWGSTDLKLFSPTAAPLIGLRDAGYPLIESSSSEGGSFSAGTSAGTAVGITIVVFAMAGALWRYIRRHRRARRRARVTTEQELTELTEGIGRMEKDGQERYEADNSQAGAEKDGNERFEAGDTGKPAEIATTTTTLAELDGGWQAPEVDGNGGMRAGRLA